VLATVWFIAGLAIGVLTCWFAPRLWPRARALARTRGAYLVVGGLMAAFVVAATILEFALAARHGGVGEAVHAGASSAATTGASSAAAQSMDAAIARLEERLGRAGGSDADWELLAKAYEFLGRSEEARRARAHVVAPSSGLSAGSAGMETLAAAAAAAGNATASGSAPPPAPVAAPAAPAASLEELERRVHDHPGDAQSWADYADVLGSLAGDSLTGAAGSAIDRALALDPNNAKALWLKASQAHEQRHFTDALTWWHRLRARLPADSPDARIIDANIAEDTQLAGKAAAPLSVAGSGTVPVDRKIN
jgi:cytochrome c-type biogenesis protein CcmH/NrfG